MVLFVVLPVILLVIAVILLPVLAAFADERLDNTVVHEQDSDQPPDTGDGPEGLLAAA